MDTNNFKSQISDFKGENAPAEAVAVGDAAVMVVAEGARGVVDGGSKANKSLARKKRVARGSVCGEVAGVLTGRKRWGKIARMPFETREWLNEQIRDGVTYAEISAALKTKGFDGVTKFDLSTWRRGGHQEWLRDQERMAAIRNDVGRVVKAVGSLSENEAEGVERFNELLIGMQIAHAVQDLHRGTLKELVEAKPELLFRIARVASDQARDRARRKRANLLVRKYDDGVTTKKVELENPMKRGLSPETLAEIEAAMAKLM
ncbi:MAG: hypothetical protein ACXWDN_11765 [Limisphaerales bacterium]